MKDHLVQTNVPSENGRKAGKADAVYLFLGGAVVALLMINSAVIPLLAAFGASARLCQRGSAFCSLALILVVCVAVVRIAMDEK